MLLPCLCVQTLGKGLVEGKNILFVQIMVSNPFASTNVMFLNHGTLKRPLFLLY